MRTVKFKAQRQDGRGWVIGHFYRSNFSSRIDKTERFYIMPFDQDEAVLIDQETLCQYVCGQLQEGGEVWEDDVFRSSTGEEGVITWDGFSWVFVVDGFQHSDVHELLVNECQYLRNQNDPRC